MSEFKTQPFGYQMEDLLRTWEERNFAILYEQGLGKSKMSIDTAAHLSRKGWIDFVLVVAPNDVHRNWIEEQLPEHLPEDVAPNSLAVYYQTDKASTKWHTAELQAAESHKGLTWVAISYDGIATSKGKLWARHIMKCRNVLFIMDESHTIKTPNAAITKTIRDMASRAKFRRILTGTPTNKPFDIYAQLAAVDDTFWKRHRLGTFQEFKNMFGVFYQPTDPVTGENEKYKILKGYKNLPYLSQLIAKISVRRTKDQELDLPPKLYSRRDLNLSKEQTVAYAELARHYVTEVELATVSAEIKLSLMGKLHQIACGFIKTDDGDWLTIPGKNPKLEAVHDIVSNSQHKVIIFAFHTQAVTLLVDSLSEYGALRFDGSLSSDECAVNKQLFKTDPAHQILVMQIDKGATGHNLTEAKTVIYFSNTFSYLTRAQSEDRAHRIGQTNPVLYVDLVMKGTIDVDIIKALRNNCDVASTVIGDQLKDWI